MPALFTAALFLLLSYITFCNADDNDEYAYYIRRCSAGKSTTTCEASTSGPTRDVFDTAFDFDDEDICENTNGVYTSVIPIKNDTSQGNQDYEPDENVYNTIQTNLNCFGGYRGLLSKQLMS